MTRDALIAAASAAGATVIRAPGACVIVLADVAPAGDDLVPLAEAATLAKCSARTIRDARRAGELVMFGGQRTRAVRRADLLAWIETRRAPVVRGADDDDMARRMARLSRSRRTGP